MNYRLLTTIVFHVAVLFSLPPSTASARVSHYDRAVLADGPVLFLPLDENANEAVAKDLSGHGHNGRYVSSTPRQVTRTLNRDQTPLFNGQNQYVEVPSHPDLSVPTTGVLTIEAWFRPDTLQFSKQEGDGYVHWAGKGVAGAHEYALRMYSLQNSANRPNRISGYAFNLSGGQGSGSYFQDPLVVNGWYGVIVVINTVDTSSTYPTGYVKIYKNSTLRDTTSLGQFSVIPETGSAPLRIGTRDLRSFFQGSIGKFAIYNRELTQDEISMHVRMIHLR